MLQLPLELGRMLYCERFKQIDPKGFSLVLPQHLPLQPCARCQGQMQPPAVGFLPLGSCQPCCRHSLSTLLVSATVVPWDTKNHPEKPSSASSSSRGSEEGTPQPMSSCRKKT